MPPAPQIAPSALGGLAGHFLFLPRPASTELRLHARRYRHNFIDLHVLLRRIERVTGSVEFLGWFEHHLRAEGGSGIVSGKQGLEFTDELLGGSLFAAVPLVSKKSLPRVQTGFFEHARFSA